MSAKKFSICSCAQAARAFTFFLQQKKVNKKCRRCSEFSENQIHYLKCGNPLRSNSPDFLTTIYLILLTFNQTVLNVWSGRYSLISRNLCFLPIWLLHFNSHRDTIIGRNGEMPIIEHVLQIYQIPTGSFV